MSKATEWINLKKSVELTLGHVQVTLVAKDDMICVHLNNPFVLHGTILLDQDAAQRLAEWITEVFK